MSDTVDLNAIAVAAVADAATKVAAMQAVLAATQAELAAEKAARAAAEKALATATAPAPTRKPWHAPTGAAVTVTSKLPRPITATVGGTSIVFRTGANPGVAASFWTEWAALHAATPILRNGLVTAA